MDKEVKFSKKIVGKPISVGERTLIPIIELSTFARNISLGKKTEELVITGVTVTPISVKVIEGEEEWILHI
ncbi:MAG: hypothetical protein ACTSXX_05300 [Candidatus Baldrarchaeia archaeon]